jgi:hypothetical protein
MVLAPYPDARHTDTITDACLHCDILVDVLQNYHLDAENNVVPVPNTGAPLIAPNQMSRAKVWTL